MINTWNAASVSDPVNPFTGLATVIFCELGDTGMDAQWQARAALRWQWFGEAWTVDLALLVQSAVSDPHGS